MSELDRVAPEFAARLSSLPEEVEEAHFRLGDRCFVSVSKSTPVDTGALRASLELRRAPLTFSVHTDDPAGAAMEFGVLEDGRKRPPRPFMGPAIARESAGFADELTEICERELTRGL